MLLAAAPHTHACQLLLALEDSGLELRQLCSLLLCCSHRLASWLRRLPGRLARPLLLHALRRESGRPWPLLHGLHAARWLL